MNKCFFTLFFSFIVMSVTGCEQAVMFDYLFPDMYDAVYCFVPNSREKWEKDTTICFSREDLWLLTLREWGQGVKSGAINLRLGTTVDILFDKVWQCDTVSFFIFDKDTVDTYSWDYIVQNYCVLQRYDFTKEDLNRLKEQIPYPPTEEMATMHMFPPYEAHLPKNP